MIKEAIDKILSLGEPHYKEYGKELYSDKPMSRIPKQYIPRAEPLKMTNLSSLLCYIKSFPEEMADKMIVQVQSYDRVVLLSGLDKDRKRECLAIAEASVPEFRFNQWLGHEEFVIGVQSKFVDDENSDKALLLKFAGTVESGTLAQYGDDGVSQKATIKTGIASKADAIVPNPVGLVAWRTFPEVEQPFTRFVFRMKGERDIYCALYEADGGAWKNQAMLNIARYINDFVREEDIKTNGVVIA